jgi:hypothetical protein
MKLTRTKHSLLIRRAMDTAFDAYLEWRARSDSVWDAYATWSSATPDDVASAFRAYVVALDQEENAANRYGALVREIRDVVAPGSAENLRELETVYLSGGGGR